MKIVTEHTFHYLPMTTFNCHAQQLLSLDANAQSVMSLLHTPMLSLIRNQVAGGVSCGPDRQSIIHQHTAYTTMMSGVIH